MATLDLGFGLDGDTTRLIRRVHTGPLRVQKPLYPEHRSTCHAIIIHPLGDVVGGDELRMQVDAGPKSRAFLSTPGAAKWYRGNGHRSRQQLRMRVAAGAALEWLPQETILFNAADVVFDTSSVAALMRDRLAARFYASEARPQARLSRRDKYSNP